MEKGKAWSIEQWENKRFKVGTLFILAAGVGLTVEWFAFSYSVWKILRYLILFAALFLIAWIDHDSKRIPNKILKALMVIRGILFIPEWLTYPGLGTAMLLSIGMGALLGGGMFLMAHFISKGGVGMGDVKLFAVIGCYVGSGSIMSVAFLSALSGAVYSISMLLLKKIKLKEEIPFAPFIFVGTMLTMVLGM